jgi:GNAT superfamily N-acetyltransferase
MAVHGHLYDAAAPPALVAATDTDVLGVVTYTLKGHALEIVSCDADPPGQGAGRALAEATVGIVRAQCVRRVWCTTTNDNLAALGSWQALGFVLVELRPCAVETARRLSRPAPPWLSWPSDP